ncbi:hypothetical protein NDU88_005790 [Pleurodeles waltl]|uniref:Uncharacterized protein n=1 Tax=Pleurodeles waltl TaxID=8319 RepID=A0AAV7WBN9_PLEWA|nr:hypothetical protein NDU88_005790 [Pleurodeles waltl]
MDTCASHVVLETADPARVILPQLKRHTQCLQHAHNVRTVRSSRKQLFLTSPVVPDGSRHSSPPLSAAPHSLPPQEKK